MSEELLKIKQAEEARKVREDLLDSVESYRQDSISTPANVMQYSAIEAQVKFLEGDILTIIDASISDREQRKALKDIIKKSFNGRLKWFGEIMSNSSDRARSK